MPERYTVTLLDAPDLTDAQRAALEAAFRAAVNDLYDGEGHAAGALFSWIDQSTEDHVEAGGSALLWPIAAAQATAQLRGQLPAGARFDCSIILD